jgi:hypothetical protein
VNLVLLGFRGDVGHPSTSADLIAGRDCVTDSPALASMATLATPPQ